jgi:hypothetical protein
VFSEEERLLREEKEFVFVRILKEPKVKVDLLKWKDERGQADRVSLFEA